MKTIKLILLGLMLVYSPLLATQEKVKTTGTNPVDEGQKNIHKEDNIKGSGKTNNTFQSKKVSLSSIKTNIYTIQRKNLSHSPFTCLHYKSKTKKLNTLEKQSNTSHSINFKIKKSLLNVGDAIIVINDVDSKKKNMPKGKKMIIEIEIIK